MAPTDSLFSKLYIDGTLVDLPGFPKKLHEIEKILVRRVPHLDPPLCSIKILVFMMTHACLLNPA